MLKKNWPLFIILLATGILMIFSLNKDLFMDWDECLYSVYTKEMAKTGNFLINQWNGYNDMQKPPGLTWLLQIPSVFSKSEFAARIPSLLAGLSLITAVYLFSLKYFSQKIAISASLLLLTTEIFTSYTQRVNTDIGYTFFIFIGIWFWLSSAKKRSYLYLAGICFGLAAMTKGLSVIQYLAPLFIAIFLQPKKQRFVDYFLMLTAFSAFVLPWHITTYLKYKSDFLQIYFYENIIQRSQNPIEFHYGSKFFYIIQIFKELFPWILAVLILPVLYLTNLKKFLHKKAIFKELKSKQIIFTILLLILVPLLMITRIKTKIAWYSIPLFPFLVIFISYSLEYLANKINKKIIFYPIVLLLLIDSSISLYNSTKLLKSKEPVSLRNEVAIASQKYPEKELYYLVGKSERIAKALLDQSPNLQIRSTFVYGGNPCAVYYSGKKVNYFYSPEEFIKILNNKNKLYLLENGDLSIIQNLPKDLPIKTLHQNPEFTLFERI